MKPRNKKVEKDQPADMNIYWCYDPLHTCDWLYAAPTAAKARNHFLSLTNLFGEKLKAKLVCKVPATISIPDTCIVKFQLLKKLGFEILSDKDPLIVRYKGKKFIQGNGDNVAYYDKSNMELSVYLMQLMNTKEYKIGFSSDVHERRKQLSRNSPGYLTILGVIQTPLARTLEKEILNLFINFRTAPDWRGLDDWGYKLLHVVFCLYYLEYQECSIDHVPSNAFTRVMEVLKPVIESHYLKKKPSDYHVKIYEAIKEGITTDIIAITARKKYIWSSHSIDF